MWKSLCPMAFSSTETFKRNMQSSAGTVKTYVCLLTLQLALRIGLQAENYCKSKVDTAHSFFLKTWKFKQTLVSSLNFRKYIFHYTDDHQIVNFQSPVTWKTFLVPCPSVSINSISQESFPWTRSREKL